MIARRRAWWLAGGAALALAAAVVAVSWPGVPRPESLPRLAVGDPAFGPTLEGNTGSAVVDGNTIQVLLNGDEIFPAKLAAIRSARATITYAEYFYADGGPARDIAAALAERCRAGVTAHVLLDGLGALTMPEAYAKLMRNAGCRVVTFRPLARLSLRRHNNRNHQRILVIDGRLGLTGGSGVSDKWTGNGREDGHWRDTDVRVEGPAVRSLQSAFAQKWREATAEVLGGESYFPPLPARGRQRAQVVRSSPATGDYAMYMMYLLAIAGAQRSIAITNPYFLPDAGLHEALLVAVDRGVRVRVLTPGKIDHNLVRSASRRGFGPLLKRGIEIYEYQPALLHAKTMVVDGRWATVASTNFDNRSFALNDELNVALYDATLATQLTRVFEEDLARARRLTFEAWQHRGLRAKLFEIFVSPIQSQL